MLPNVRIISHPYTYRNSDRGVRSVLSADAAHLLPHLLQLSPEHHAEGLLLQADVLAFQEELKTAVEEIWTKSSPELEEGVETTPEGWAARMKEYERQKRIDPLEKVARPDIGKESLGQRMGEV